MGNTQLECLFYVLFPAFVGQARRAIDEVDADIVQSGVLGFENALQGLPGIVDPVHPPEVLFKKGLNANAKPADPRLSPRVQPAGDGHIIRIGFQCQLSARGNGKEGVEFIKDTIQLLCCEEGRSASSKINSLHRSTADIIPSGFHFFQ